MKAYVINQEQMKQYGLGVVVSLLVAFLSGYFLGVQQADPGAQSKQVTQTEKKDVNATEQLAQQKAMSAAPLKDKNKEMDNKKNVKKNTLKKEKTSADKKAQKKIEKKKAEKKIKSDNKVAKKTQAKKTQAKKNQPRKKQTEKKTTAKPVAIKPKTTKEAPKKVADTKPKQKKAPAVAVAKANTEAITKPANATANTRKSITGQTTLTNLAEPVKTPGRKYSIQAGMFASKSNAESFIEKLAEKNYEAYVSDFVSSSGATKYNVRVGRYDSRDLARKHLKEYQKAFSSPAYVVITQ